MSLKSSEGNQVAWGPDSRRPYYVNTEGLQLIELETGPTLGVARRRLVGRFSAVTDYDLSPDGRAFIVVRAIRAVADVIVAVPLGRRGPAGLEPKPDRDFLNGSRVRSYMTEVPERAEGRSTGYI